jgi:hypothetical protein
LTTIVLQFKFVATAIKRTLVWKESS